MVESKIKSEKMSLDEAIKHAEITANECEVKARILVTPAFTKKSLERCGKEHRQLAEWLKELKELRNERIELKKQNLILRFIVALYEEDDEPDWIPVEELPEEYGRYLVCFKQGIGIPCRVDICNYGEDCGTFDEEPHWFLDYEKYVALMDDEVEAWMKLPDPCEE